MRKIKYHKLVRNLIPEIIASSGKTCTTAILSDADYLTMLDAKLNEVELKRISTDIFGGYCVL